LLGEEMEPVFGAVEELVEKGWIEPAPERSGVYDLVRPELGEMVLESQPGERCRELHRAWARILEDEHGDDEEEAGAIAQHYWMAEERAAALPFLERAAQRAQAVLGFRDAAELWGRTAEVARELGDEEREIAALLAQADALDSAGSSFRALSLYRGLIDRLEEESRRASDRRRLAGLWLGASRLYGRLGEFQEQLSAARRGLGFLEDLAEPALEVELEAREAEALLRRGSREEAFEVARSALRRATRNDLTRLRATLLDILGLVAIREGEGRKARWLFRRGLLAAEEVADERLAAKVRGDLALLLWRVGRWEEARDRLRMNLEVARRLRDPWGELAALDSLGTRAGETGDWKEAREPLRRSLELRRRLGSREGEARAWLRLGEVEEMLGDWDSAERHYRRTRRLAQDEPLAAEDVEALARLSSLARKRGDWVKAEDLGRTALSEAERRGHEELLAASHHQLGLVEKDREHWAPASAHLQRALEIAERDQPVDPIRGRIMSSLIDLHLRREEREKAELLVERLQEWVEERDESFEGAKLRTAQARLLVIDGETEEADGKFGEAVRILEELEVPFEYARCLYEWGVRTRNPEIALERLDRALVALERLGAATEFERTRGVMEGIRQRHQLGAGGVAGGPGLWEIAKVINSTLDLQEVLDRIMDLVLQRLKADRGMVVFSSDLTGELEVAASRNLGGGEEEGHQLSETVVREVVESREPVLSVDALTDPRFSGSESIVASHIVSILCVPLTIRDRPVGAIYVDHLESQHLFDAKDLEFLAAFADQAAVAIENARLYGELEERRERLKEENESLRREILSNRHLGSLIGKSRAITQLKETLERVAASNSTVLIRGESGTGKGLVARILHSISPRREGPFVHFNCAALPENLVESELFGHEKGAFTGAVGQKPGRFELAHEGTIFLDEIGKISLAVQAKLLRVVEDREFERVGGTRTIETNARIVTATNVNLEEAISEGEFREDLYYRLNIIPIILPPLRERREDIPYLVEHFLEKITGDLGQEPREIDREVLDLFYSYEWPGNIRELEAAIHRALVLSPRETLQREDFAWILGEEGEPGPGYVPGAAGLEEGNYGDLMDRYDRELVGEALRICDGGIRKTARFLGIARNTLKSKMEKYGLEP
ncbi:MAG: sigma 54-interacting transcriptional regulator, partial [Thermoanaerobaculia bacterium]|nr:sigma 54-interacting transcriptional regulator [Thermoanaerobaculia bacterium]